MRRVYADQSIYGEYSEVIPKDEIERALRKASRHIDSLTYNRIVGIGFENLTQFQQKVIEECVCELADFEYVNQELIDSVLQEYSINGTSMKFGESWNISVQNGIAIRREIYELLKQTGLCCRRL